MLNSIDTVQLLNPRCAFQVHPSLPGVPALFHEGTFIFGPADRNHQLRIFRRTLLEGAYAPYPIQEDYDRRASMGERMLCVLRVAGRRENFLA